MNIQLFIVIIIGITVGIIILYQLYKFFFVKKDSPYCNGCSGCDISEKHKKEEKSYSVKNKL